MYDSDSDFYTNHPNAFPRYSGVAQEINRAGFTSGETDLSGIGYENHWSIIQIGRGRQSWGAGNDIQLAISDQSPSYDYGLIGLLILILIVIYPFYIFIKDKSDSWKNKYQILLLVLPTIGSYMYINVTDSLLLFTYFYFISFFKIIKN